MAYDERLAQRVRKLLAQQAGLSEQRMFGGLAFLLGGHMCVGIVKDRLMVRVGPAAYAGLVAEPHARKMDFTGKPMKGLVYVEPGGVASDGELRRWVGHGVAYVRSLPSKQARGARSRP